MKHYLMLLMCLLVFLPISAQVRTVHGTVVDATGEPVIGASVRVNGTSRGTVTDQNGKFSVEAGAKDKLTISYVGFMNQVVNARDNLMISLQEDAKLVNEVVVVGYGTQKKATLTGAVSMVNSEEIVATKNQNVQNMLTGKIPGVRVIQKTSQPGEFSNQFDIRGFGSPLIVIDGVPRGDMERMDPNEIESISVLKDGSAAIYGVRAANGVVLITTKKGKGKPKIEYNMYMGFQHPADILKPVGALDRYILSNEVSMRDLVNPTQKYADELMEPYINGTKVSTDWYDAIMKNSAPQASHNVNVSGSSDRVDYFLNFGYQDQGGFFQMDALNYYRFNVRSNVNVQVTRNLKVGLRLAALKDRQRSNNSGPWQVFKNLWRSVPSDPIYANNTAPYYQNPESADDNPLPLIDMNATGWIKNRVKSISTTFDAEYQVPYVKGLSLKAMFSYDTRDTRNENWRKAYSYYEYNEAANAYNGALRNGPTNLNEYSGESYTTLWNASINYDNTFARHHVTGLLLFEESHSEGNNLYASRNFSIPLPYLFAGDSEDQVGSSNAGGIYENANQGFVGRLNYDYAGRYMLEFSFRYDGSSKFAPGHQWGFFPGVSAGWRISEEPFIKNNSRLKFIDNIKLRGSWGKMGDDGSSSYQFVSGYDYPNTSGGMYSNYPTGYMFGGAYTNALGFRAVPNENLTWFTVKTTNVGLDVDLWNELFGFTFELFQRDRNGLLANRMSTVPGTFGSSMPQENLNSDRTKGVELELRHKNRIGDFSYSITGQVALTRGMNRYYEANPAGNSYDYWRNRSLNRYKDIWWGLGADGRWESWDQIIHSMYSGDATYPGDYKYLDWNEDGVIDGNDYHPIATTTNPGGNFQDHRNYPLLNYGLTFTAAWKGIDLNMLWQGAGMAYVGYGEQLSAPLLWDGNALEMFMDRWRPADPKANPNDPNIQWISGSHAYGGSKGTANVDSEFMIQKGDYVRLKSLEVGYSLPKSWLSPLGVQRFRIYFNAYNLLTFTGVDGVDPERPAELYGYMYPLNKTYNFGVNVTF